MLGTSEDKATEAVDEIETADIVLLLMEIAGTDEKR